MTELVNRTVVRNGAHYWIKDLPETEDTPKWDFWRVFESGEWEPHLEDVLSSALTKDSVMVDIGAWIGPVSLIAARMCTAVHAFEPDPVAYGFLRATASRQRRKNIRTYKKAVAPHPGEITLGCKAGNTLGDSMTSPWYGDGSAEMTVTTRAITPEEIIDSIGIDSARLRLVKVDIEGGEELIIDPLVEALRPIGASILLSTHGLLIEDDAARMSYITNMLSAIDGCDVQRVSGTWEGLGTVLVTVP